LIEGKRAMWYLGIFIVSFLIMAFYYAGGVLENRVRVKLREAAEETKRDKFLELINEAVNLYTVQSLFFTRSGFSLYLFKESKSNPFLKRPKGSNISRLGYWACYDYWHSIYLPRIRKQYLSKKFDLVLSAFINLALPAVLFVTLFSSKGDSFTLRVLAAVATSIMAALGCFSSYRRFIQLTVDEEMLAQLDSRFIGFTNEGKKGTRVNQGTY
jgi:predicted permease